MLEAPLLPVALRNFDESRYLESNPDGQMVKRGSRDLCRLASPVSCNKCFPDLRPEFVTLRAARLKAALGECDVFVFPSEFIAERYVEWGLPQEKCVVIPNGQTNLGTTFDRSQHSRQPPRSSSMSCRRRTTYLRSRKIPAAKARPAGAHQLGSFPWHATFRCAQPCAVLSLESSRRN